MFGEIYRLLKNMVGLTGSPYVMPYPLELAEVMASSFPGPVFVLDGSKDKILWASPGAIAFAGVTAEELRHMSATAFLERFFQPSETLLQLFQEKVREAHYELWFRGKEPRYVVGLWMGLEREDSILPTRFMLVFQDATELENSRQTLLQYAEELKQQIHSLESLLQEKQRIEKSYQESSILLSLFRSATDYMAEGLILLEEQGKVIWANMAAHQLLEVSPEKLTGIDYTQLPLVLAALFSEARVSGVPVHEELRLSSQGHWVSVQIQPLSFSDRIEDKRFYLIVLEYAQEKKLYQDMYTSFRAYWEETCQEVLTQSAPVLRSFRLWQKGIGVFPIAQKLPESGILLGAGKSADGRFIDAFKEIRFSMGIGAKLSNWSGNIASLWQALQVDIQNLGLSCQMSIVWVNVHTYEASLVGEMPVWLFRDGEIYILIGVGVTKREPVYFRLQPGDRIYIFSENIERAYARAADRPHLSLREHLTRRGQADLSQQFQELESIVNSKLETDMIMVGADF